MHVRAEAASAAVVRAGLIADLSQQGLPDQLTHDVALVATELITNSLRHARPLPADRLAVNWESDHDGVMLRITDGGGDITPQLVDSGPSDPAGRGLTIVDSLASDWGVEFDVDRVTVWAYLMCNPAAS